MVIPSTPLRATLVTRGRKTGKKHSVMLRGVMYNNKIYFSRHRPDSDWFADPAGDAVKDDAPAALFIPPDQDFTLSARVAVDFASTFDAGVLQLRESDSLWAKLCFEYSPQGQPMIVSVWQGVSLGGRLPAAGPTTAILAR